MCVCFVFLCYSYQSRIQFQVTLNLLNFRNFFHFKTFPPTRLSKLEEITLVFLQFQRNISLLCCLKCLNKETIIQQYRKCGIRNGNHLKDELMLKNIWNGFVSSPFRSKLSITIHLVITFHIVKCTHLLPIDQKTN